MRFDIKNVTLDQKLAIWQEVTQKWSNNLMKKIPRNPEKEAVGGGGSNETRNLDPPPTEMRKLVSL